MDPADSVNGGSSLLPGSPEWGREAMADDNISVLPVYFETLIRQHQQHACDHARTSILQSCSENGCEVCWRNTERNGNNEEVVCKMIFR